MDETEAFDQIGQVVLKWKYDQSDVFFAIWNILDEVDPFTENEQIIQMRRTISDYLNGYHYMRTAVPRIVDILEQKGTK